MKITLSKFAAEDFNVQNFEKFSRKKQQLTGKQSVKQLVGRVESYADPDAKFENADLNTLSQSGWLDELLTGIKTGKEASVYLGKNSAGFVAVKVYTDLRVRAFKRDAAYSAGRYTGDARLQKAIDQRSQKGLDARQQLWVQEEFKQMQYLDQHGVSVPKAIAFNGLALIMEFIGDENGNPAPRISDLKMDKAEAAEAFRQSVLNLKLMVRSGRVHGDYSTFNILWHTARAVIIDFPQVIEIEHNRQAAALLERDVHSLCTTFRRQGITADEAKIFREVRAG